MTKHTPGPWKAIEGRHGWQIHTDNAGAKHNHWIANIKCESCPAHEEANARLIAATPDLLTAGKHLAVKLAEIYRAANLEPAECQSVRDWMLAVKKAESDA